MSDVDTSAKEEFAEWFRKNYPGPDTIIYRPDFHSESIFRSATHRFRVERDALTAEVEHLKAQLAEASRTGFVTRDNTYGVEDVRGFIILAVDSVRGCTCEFHSDPGEQISHYDHLERTFNECFGPAPDPVAQAARVLLDHTPNPVFDRLKAPLIGEFEISTMIQDGDDEYEIQVPISWTTTKDVIHAALRALAGESDS